MKIGGLYPFKNGRDIIETQYPTQWAEVQQIIAGLDSSQHKTKESNEKTMPGKVLYSAPSLNSAFKTAFEALNWHNHKVNCDYPTAFYVDGYSPTRQIKGAYRDMDFVKDQLGVEVQFGKYAFMVYNVCAKMTIFHNLGIIQAGIEIVPLKEFADEMSTGVSYFEQFVWDLEQRGSSDIDIPVLVVGITA